MTSDDESPFTVTSYSWDTTGCFADDRGNRRCFPRNQDTQSVSEDDVFAKDAGTVRCTAVINSGSFTSGPFTLRISGTVYMYVYGVYVMLTLCAVVFLLCLFWLCIIIMLQCHNDNTY